MAIPPDMPSFATVIRPFGSGIVVITDQNCRVVPNFRKGMIQASGLEPLRWSHWIDFPTGPRPQDALVRPAGLNEYTYNDGDEVRVTDGDEGITQIFVVVYVEFRYIDTPQAYFRAYCMRTQIF